MCRALSGREGRVAEVRLSAVSLPVLPWRVMLEMGPHGCYEGGSVSLRLRWDGAGAAVAEGGCDSPVAFTVTCDPGGDALMG